MFLRIVKHRFRAKLLTSVVRDQCRNCDQSYLSSSDDSCSLELQESDGQELWWCSHNPIASQKTAKLATELVRTR